MAEEFKEKADKGRSEFKRWAYEMKNKAGEANNWDTYKNMNKGKGFDKDWFKNQNFKF